jgi:hypothetical protein
MRAIVAIALAYLLAPSAAHAATFYACKSKALGAIRIVSATTTCTTYETKISWSDGVGPKGDKGDRGAAGPPFAGCSSTSTTPYLAISGGNSVCQARYFDNGDGTVTDNKTGLMWEKKSPAGTGGVHDVDIYYAWSSSGSAADGALFTVFLATLNSDVSIGGTSTCFANHCDWRIPNIVELQSTLLTPFPCNTFPCIDPTFGPTQVSIYWSSSSLAGYPGWAWYVHFSYGYVDETSKSGTYYARAVRSGR